MASLWDVMVRGRAQTNLETNIERQTSKLAELLGTAPELDPTANQYPQGGLMGPQALPAGAMTAGSGLLADPTDPRRLAAYGSGVMAEFPVVGGSIINAMQGNEAAKVTQGMAGNQAMERQRVIGEYGLAQQAQADIAAKQRQDSVNAVNAANQAAQNELSRVQAAQQMAQGQEPWKYDLTAAKPAINPYNGTWQKVAVAGTPEYEKAQQGADPLSAIVGDMYELTRMVSEYGSEAGGPNAGKMASLYTSLLPRINQARGAGVPQAAELELLMQGLPNPNDWLTNAAGFVPGQRSKMEGGYNEAYRQVSEALVKWATLYPQVTVDLSKVDPNVLSPEKRAYIESNRVSPDPWLYEQAKNAAKQAEAQQRAMQSAQRSVGVLRD